MRGNIQRTLQDRILDLKGLDMGNELARWHKMRAQPTWLRLSSFTKKTN